MRKLDSFDGINEFVAVAEHQGFSAAAKILNCSTSHVSRQVAKLEERLACSLLARTTRLVSLTPDGQAYYEQCKDIVQALNQANEQIRFKQYQLNGTLRVTAAGTFAEEYVVPALIDFAKEHLELNIDINFNSRNVNFVEEGIDFAIRYGQLSDSSLIARPLAKRPMMAVSSAQYLHENGTPNCPDDLKQHSCIVANNDVWRFSNKNTTYNVKVDGRWRCNTASGVVNACIQGLGIAYMPKANFNEGVEKNMLVPVLEPYWSAGANSSIVYQNKQFLPLRARVAIDYLLERFKDWHE